MSYPPRMTDDAVEPVEDVVEEHEVPQPDPLPSAVIVPHGATRPGDWQWRWTNPRRRFAMVGRTPMFVLSQHGDHQWVLSPVGRPGTVLGTFTHPSQADGVVTRSLA